MPYINTAERVGLEKGELIGIQKVRREGHQEGRQEGEAIALKKRLGLLRNLL